MKSDTANYEFQSLKTSYQKPQPNVLLMACKVFLKINLRPRSQPQNIKKHNKFVHFIHIYFFLLLVCSQKIRTP